MKEWLLGISATVLLTSVVSLILPEGRSGKYVKSFFSVLVVLVIISPVIRLANSDFRFSDLLYSDNVFYQDDYIFYINEAKTETMENNCTLLLKEKGVLNAVVKINYTVSEDYIYSIEKVEVFLDNAVIKSDGEHINIIEEISVAVSDYLNIDIKAVNVYE